MFCLSIQNSDYDMCRHLLSTTPMVEIRGDLSFFSDDEYSKLFEHNNLLYTFRAKDTNIAYNQLKKSILLGAKMVDIELSSSHSELLSLLTIAREHNTKVVISYHNYINTPSITELEDIYLKAMNLGGDIIKIVTTANSLEDGVDILKLYDSDIVKNSSTPLIAFAMGERGRFSRRVALTKGAPFAYVSLDNESQTASGQYTLKEMERLFNPNNYPYIIDNNISIDTTLTIPCSKSISQRAVLAAALSEGVTTLHNYSPCNDSEAIISVIELLGCKVERRDDVLTIVGGCFSNNSKDLILDIGESGLLTRLMMPIALLLTKSGNNNVTISGNGTILGRDMSSAIDVIRSLGAEVTAKNNKYLPLTIRKGVTTNNIEIDGSEGSQIVSGVLMLLPLLHHDTLLRVKNATSIPYIKLTIKTLNQFGIELDEYSEAENYLLFKVRGNQKYNVSEFYLDSDWSSAALFCVVGALKHRVTLKNMLLGSLQADEEILSIIKECGATVKETLKDNGLYDITITPTVSPQSFSVDLTNSPDLFPAVALLSTQCEGISVVKGVERLYNKESNRAEAIYTEFSSLGAIIDIKNNHLIVSNSKLKAGKVSSHNDHRMAMTFVIASYICDIRIAIDNISCINKSFPQFLSSINIL